MGLISYGLHTCNAENPTLKLLVWSAMIAIGLIAFGQVAEAQSPRTTLRYGTDPTGGAPFIYQNERGEYVGFEVDFANYLASKLGRTSTIVKGSWDKLPQLLDQPISESAGIDLVLNGYELRDDLSKEYQPTLPYYVYRVQLLAHRDDETIDGWNDLAAKAGRPGKSVGVLGGTVAHDYLKQRFGSTIDLQINEDVATVIGLVKDRRLSATVQDSPACTYFLKEIPELKTVGEPMKPGFYVMYLRKGDAELREQINKAIKEGIDDGTLRTIYAKYGLWNDDQERLAYWKDRAWPPAGADAPAGQAAIDAAEKPSRWQQLRRLTWELLGAALLTIELSLVSFPLAMILGMAIAVGRVFGPRWVRAPLAVYVELVRGTPLLLQLYSMFYLLPPMLTWLQMQGIWVPIQSLTPFQAGILGLAVNYSAYEAENYRAGLLAIPRGQMEAALALGMSRFTAIRRIIIPQAARLVIPPVTNDFIALFKDTSVCSAIQITELTRKYNELYNFNRDYIVELVFITAGLYLLMSYPFAILARWLERRWSLGTSAN